LHVLDVIGPLGSADVGLPAAVGAATAVAIAPAVVPATVLVVAAVVLTVARGTAVPAVTVTAVVTSRILVRLGMSMAGTARICGYRSDAGTDDAQRSDE
jgi:hypothetical protein